MFQENRISKKVLVLTYLVLIISFTACDTTKKVPEYNHIDEFSSQINERFRSFLDTSLEVKGRKVAIFDCDGTLLGQVPHYLADESLYSYANSHFSGKNDSLSKAKMGIVDRMINGDKVANSYIEDRIHFFSGMKVNEVEEWGTSVYKRLYDQKLYPEMRKVIQNLKSFDFEVWVITASPEILYQQFISNELGIPKNRIIGVKSVVKDSIITNQLVNPIPQEEGKANTIETFIQHKPLFVAGNSLGDIEMIEESSQLKWIINPDSSEQQPKLGGKTIKEHASDHNWLITNITDTVATDKKFISDKWQLEANRPTYD